MGTLTINGRKVTVDDGFAKLSPADQEKTVNEIAASMGRGPKTFQPGVKVPPRTGPDQTSTNIEDRSTPQFDYNVALGNFRKANPNVSPADWAEFVKRHQPYNAGDLFNAGLTLNFNDELAGAAGGVTGLLSGGNFGDSYKRYSDLEKAREKLGAQQAGPLGTVAQLAGGVFSGGPLNPANAGAILPRVIEGAKGGTVLGGLASFGASDANNLHDRLTDTGKGALIGAGLGVATPVIGDAVGQMVTRGAQKAATSAAIKNAPAASDLAQTSRQLFQKVDQSGVTVDTPAFESFVQNLVSNAKKMRINPTLDPKASGAFQELIGALDDVQKSGGALTVSDLHTLRQIAQKAAVSTEGRDAMFANQIVNGIDDFVTKPGALVGANGPKAGNDLLSAISTWGRSRRVSMIETAMEKAQNSASGFENGLRVEFRKLLNNDKVSRLFTAQEREAIQKVVRGNTLSNLTRLAGMFGFNLGKGSKNFVGGSIGFAINPAVALAGTGARYASEKLTESAANRAARIVATPNIPTVAPIALPPAVEEALKRVSWAGQSYAAGR